MTGPAICPHCGYNLRHSAEIERDGWRYVPGTGLFFGDRRLSVSNPIAEMVGALMLADGRVLSREVLVERMGADSINPDNLIGVFRHRFARAVQAAGLSDPIETVWGQGLRWAPGARRARVPANRFVENVSPLHAENT